MKTLKLTANQTKRLESILNYFEEGMDDVTCFGGELSKDEKAELKACKEIQNKLNNPN